MAAHASGVKFNLMDAKELYEFARAICEYVFVLIEEFETFEKRHAKRDLAAVGRRSEVTLQYLLRTLRRNLGSASLRHTVCGT